MGLCCLYLRSAMFTVFIWNFELFFRFTFSFICDGANSIEKKNSSANEIIMERLTFYRFFSLLFSNETKYVFTRFRMDQCRWTGCNFLETHFLVLLSSKKPLLMEFYTTKNIFFAFWTHEKTIYTFKKKSMFFRYLYFKQRWKVILVS